MSDTLIDVTAPLWRPFQLRLNPKSGVQGEMLQQFTAGEAYEPGTFHTFTELVRPGDTVIDVGAHVGVFTCLAAALVGISGRVLAFEPDSSNRRRLIENVQLNGFSQVTVDKRPVAERIDRLAFFSCADNDGGHALWNPAKSLGNPKTRAHPRQRILESVTIDSAVQALAAQPAPLNPVRLIKIDTEGAELSVLKGAVDTLLTHRPAIVAEINAVGLSHMGGSEGDLRDFIRQYGYAEYVIQDHAPYHVPIATDLSMQQEFQQDGQRCLPVFNMLFLPTV